jgi:hypothetical protein
MAFDAAAEATATRNLISHTHEQADAAIARLSDQATKWTISALSAVANLSLASLSTATGTKPALTTLTLPTFTAADFTALAAPALPSAPSVAAGTSSMWSETFWTNLKSKLTAFTDNITGADDIDTVVTKLTADTTKMQVALYAKDYERKTQTLRDLYSGAEASTGAAGFSFPNSMTTALKLDAQQKFQFDLTQTSRELVTTIFDWAKSNYQFSLQQGVAAHGSDVEFNIRYLGVTLEAYTANVNALLDKYKAEVSTAISKAEIKVKEHLTLFTAELDKQRTLKEIQLKDAGFDLDVAKVNADITAEDLKIKLDDFKARVSSFLETAKTNLADRDANIKNQITAASAAASAAAALASTAGTLTVNTNGG